MNTKENSKTLRSQNAAKIDSNNKIFPVLAPTFTDLTIFNIQTTRNTIYTENKI